MSTKPKPSAFQTQVLDLLDSIRNECVAVRASAEARDAKIAARLEDVADTQMILAGKHEREINETRFAILDAVNGDPEGHAHNLHYIAHELPKDFAAGGRMERLAKQMRVSPELWARCLRDASAERRQTVAVVAIADDGTRTLIANDGSPERSAELVTAARAAGIVFEGDAPALDGEALASPFVEGLAAGLKPAARV